MKRAALYARVSVYRRHRRSALAARSSDEWIVVPGPVIIDRDLVQTVQQRLRKNKRFALRHTNPDHPLLLPCLLRGGCLLHPCTPDSLSILEGVE